MNKYKGLLDTNNSNEFWECKYKLKIGQKLVWNQMN